MRAERYDDFDQLMLRHGKMVRWMCWIYSGGDESRTADLVQEVLIGLWQCRETLRPGASEMQERAWVRWRGRSVLQHLGRRQRVETVAMPQQVLEAMDMEQEQSEAERQRELLYSLAGDLTEHERMVLDLLLENYSVAEIAERLGIKPQSVSQLKLRMLEKMRNQSKKQ